MLSLKEIFLATATLCLLATPNAGLQAQTSASAAAINRNAAVVKRDDGSTITVSSRRRGTDSTRIANELNRRLTKEISSYTSQEIGAIAAELGETGPANLTISIKCDVSYPPFGVKCSISATW
jgi:hypothetical protein